MPIKSVAKGQQARLRSGRPLKDVLSLVAAVVGAKDQQDEVETLNAVRLSMFWLTELDWEWYRQTTTITTVAGTASYSFPVDRVQDIHHMRVSSSDGRPLRFVRRDHYDNLIWDQSSSGRFTHYSLERFGDSNKITFLPTPNAAETVTVEYFREPTTPQFSGNVIDVGEHMELPLVLYAQMLVGQWRGKPQNWINTQAQLAMEARRGAFAKENHYDEDVRIIPMEEHATPAASLDVAPSYYERFIS